MLVRLLISILIFQVWLSGNLQPVLGQTVQEIHEAAHAHNDYYHKRPLLDALDNGFCSVEADILLVDGKLLVAHSYLESRKDRTLDKLYLQPLKRIIEKNDGTVHRRKSRFLLLIDVKTNADETFKELDKQLKRYPEIFSHYKDGKWNKKPVLVIISGNRPKQAIKNQNYKIAAIDGRLFDLGKGIDSKFMPLISDRWGSHFKWKGRKEFPEAERKKLRSLVERSHREKKIIRFWGIPDKDNVWKELKNAGVDLINTDKLTELNRFLSKEE